MLPKNDDNIDKSNRIKLNMLILKNINVIFSLKMRIILNNNK
jgi:hypothetical protein